MKSDATTWIPGCDEHHDARASDHWHTRECPTNHRDRDQRRKERQDRTDVGQSLLERVCVRDSQCNDTLQHDRTGRHLAFGDPEPRWQVAVRTLLTLRAQDAASLAAREPGLGTPGRVPLI